VQHSCVIFPHNKNYYFDNYERKTAEINVVALFLLSFSVVSLANCYDIMGLFLVGLTNTLRFFELIFLKVILGSK